MFVLVKASLAPLASSARLICPATYIVSTVDAESNGPTVTSNVSVVVFDSVVPATSTCTSFDELVGATTSVVMLRYWHASLKVAVALTLVAPLFTGFLHQNH